MEINEDLWSQHQYQVLVSFVHHLAYYRVLGRLYNELRRESEFWTKTIDAHLLRAVIDWCMVFGTDSNEIHWKRVAADRESQCNFRCHLQNVTGMTQGQVNDYWSKITTFRNNFAAHRIVASRYPSVLYMDNTLLFATAYDDWFRQAVDAVFDEPSLKDRYERIMRTSEEPFRQLIEYGPTLKQEYEGKQPPRF